MNETEDGEETEIMGDTEGKRRHLILLVWGSPQPDLTRHFGRVPIYRRNGKS